MRPSRTSSTMRSGITGLCLLAGLLVGRSAVYAQDQPTNGSSRAGLLAAERDRKAEEVTPPERSRVEHALYWYDNQYVLSRVFGGWHGLRMAGGDFPAGAGIKVGGGYRAAG